MSERLVARGLAIVALSLFCVHSAEATAIRLSDGTTTVTVGDNTGLDETPATDVVTFDGTIGAWKLNVTTGVSLFSSPTNPFLQLASLNANTNAQGTLTIWFTDTGFGPTGTLVEAAIQGLTLGTITYETYQGVAPFQQGTLLTSQTYDDGLFWGTDTGTLPSGTGPYSLTQKITIVHTGKQLTTFNSTLDVSGTVVSVPDSGSTVSLLGLALLAVGVLRRIASL